MFLTLMTLYEDKSFSKDIYRKILTATINIIKGTQCFEKPRLIYANHP